MLRWIAPILLLINVDGRKKWNESNDFFGHSLVLKTQTCMEWFSETRFTNAESTHTRAGVSWVWAIYRVYPLSISRDVYRGRVTTERIVMWASIVVLTCSQALLQFPVTRPQHLAVNTKTINNHITILKYIILLSRVHNILCTYTVSSCYVHNTRLVPILTTVRDIRGGGVHVGNRQSPLPRYDLSSSGAQSGTEQYYQRDGRRKKSVL